MITNFKKTTAILIVLLFHFSQILVGQNPPASSFGIITGKVLEESGKVPMEYANIVLYRAADSSMINGCLSKNDGSFQLTKIPEGKYYITIDFVGFKKKFVSNIEITSAKKEFNLAEILLSTSLKNLSQVEIISEVNKVEYKIDKKVVNVSQNVLSAGGNASDILKNTPGIQVDPQGNIIIKGSSVFTVLIDGKPTILQGNDALKQIPASQIQNIEIITNPSAKYDPDGVSGIINLVLKKQNLNGFNGNITLNYCLPIFPYGDAMFNYRKNKFNFFFGFFGNQRPNPASSLIEGKISHGDTTRIMTASTNHDVVNNMMNIKSGFDFYINKTNTFSLSGEFGNWNHLRNLTSKGSNYYEPSWFENYDLITDKLALHRNYYVVTSSYQHQYEKPGKSLIMSFVMSEGRGSTENSNETEITDKYFNPIVGLLSKTRFVNHDPRKLFRFKTDYTLPLGEKYKLEAGLKADANISAADYVFERFNSSNNTWTNDYFFSNTFDYHQYVLAAYSTFSGIYKKYEYLAGLRAEYTDRLFDQKTTQTKYPWTDFNFFPSVHISRPITEKSQIQLSYSRRINRPGERSLNPYPDYADKYLVSKGNPALAPEFINSYEVNYMQEFKKWDYSVETYYRHTTNVIDQVLGLMGGDTMISTSYNFGKTFELGFTTSSTLKFVKNFTFIPSFTWYLNYLNGKTYNQKALVYTEPQWNSNLTCQYALKKRTNLQVAFNYSGRRNSSLARIEPFYQLSVSMRHTFKNEKMWISIQAQDFMPFTKYETYTYYDGSILKNTYDPKPTIIVSFTYRINKFTQRKQTDLNGIIGT